MKEKVLGGLALAGAFAVLYFFAVPSYRHGEPSVAGRTAPDFALEMNGHQIHLSDLRGKVVVLDFWATWCPPCVEEAPSLNALQQQIEPQGGDGARHQPGRRSRRLPEIFDRARRRTSRLTASQRRKSPPNMARSMIPEAYLISKDGKIAKKIVGPQDWTSPELISSIETLLHSH